MNAVYLTREFDQPPQVVFDALTNPDYIVRWFGPPNMYTRKAEVDLQVGGKYIFHLEHDGGGGFNIEGIYRRIDPPGELVFTLNYVGTKMSRLGESLITLRLSALEPGRTRLMFRQEFTLKPENMEGRTKAWEAMFEKMNELLIFDNANSKRS